MIDSHCHLEMVSEFYDIHQVIENFKNKGGTALLTISTDPESLKFLNQDFSSFPVPIYISSGWHPHEAKTYTNDIEKDLELLLKKPNCIAVGEIGLDYFYDHSPKNVQKDVFVRQIDLSNRYSKPIIIHTRDAEDDTYEILKASHKQDVLIHCFTGTMGFAKKCIDLGYFLSFSGIITFKNASDLREVVKYCPMDRMLIETDAPFLTPIPHRNKKNEPMHVYEVGKQVAQIKQISLEDVFSTTTDNFLKFFNV